MFFYRDAQYHRIGVNLHQIPVNCPFMAQSFSSLNFDGAMRVDANHAGNKQYAPNSFAHKFRPDAAEAPYAVNGNIVSRKSHYWHEGKKSEYDQARDLRTRVMSETARKNTCYNTAKNLRLVKYPEIQEKYLAQLYNIAPDYAEGVYNGLTEHKFPFDAVKKRAEDAQTWYKESKFRPSKGAKIVGKVPSIDVYNLD